MRGIRLSQLLQQPHQHSRPTLLHRPRLDTRRVRRWSLSDGWGPRWLLVAGIAICAVALAQAQAPNVEFAVAARFVQGFSGAAGIGGTNRTASLFTVMMAIGGIAPVVAPPMGSGLVGVIGRRGVFLVPTGFVVVMLVGVLTCVPESTPAERRRPGGVTHRVRDVGAVLTRPAYVGYTLSCALAFTAMFAYISGSPFVLQDVLHLSSDGYTLAFTVNAAGLVAVSTLSARLSSRLAPRRLVVTGLAIMVTVTAALFVTGAALGLVTGNAAAPASAQVTDVAGTGSAQFGALVSPLVGSSATTMVTASVLTSAALALMRSSAPPPVEALTTAP